jgi:hypothetical protein
MSENRHKRKPLDRLVKEDLLEVQQYQHNNSSELLELLKQQETELELYISSNYGSILYSIAIRKIFLNEFLRHGKLGKKGKTPALL